MSTTSANGCTPTADSAAKRALVLSMLIALCMFYVVSLAFFWNASRNFLDRAEPSIEPNDKIGMATEIAVGRDGCVSCRLSGWSAPEVGWAWMRAETAILAFRAPELSEIGRRDAVLVLDAAAFLPRRAERVLHVEVNDTLIGDEKFSAGDARNAAFFRGASYLHSFALPNRLVAGQRTLIIKLHMVSAGSPRRYFWSTDRRELGIAVRSVALRYAD